MAANTNRNCLESIDLTFPEILSTDILSSILSERGILQADSSLEKHQLVDLFHKYIIPLPQREFRKNRRGKKMTVLREEQEERKRKLKDNSKDSEPELKKLRVSSDYKSSTNDRSIDMKSPPVNNVTGDRLKPPPSAINWDRKTIKLSPSSSSSSSSSFNTSRNNSVLNESSKKVIKLINKTLETADLNRKSNNCTSPVAAKIKLKRDSGSNSQVINDKVVETQERKEVASEEKQKKHKPITWP